jgi:hypothetical protein
MARRLKQVYLTLGAVVRDQEHYIKEWLAFYYLMGVERFVIVLHKCSDNTERQIKSLPFYSKCIQLFELQNDEQHIQMGVYEKIWEDFGKSTKWLLYIDTDEFMFPLKLNSLSELLHDYEDFSSLSVNQRMFGHSNLVTRPEGLSIEKFIYTVHSINSPEDRAVKTVFQPQYLRALFSPHFQICRTLPQVRSDKKPFILVNHFMSSEPPLQNIVRYNHYYTRSMEDFIARNLRGSCNDKRRGTVFYGADHFSSVGKGLVVNEDILRWSDKLHELLDIPYYNIRPSNVKTLTWADGVYGGRMAEKGVIPNAKKKGIDVVPVVNNPVLFKSIIDTKLIKFHGVIKKEQQEGTEYLLCVDARDSFFIEDMETLCHKLRTMYSGKVICCARKQAHPFTDAPFPFQVHAKYGGNGFADPCAFFGKTDDLDKLFTELAAVYYRLKNKEPKTAVEQFLIQSRSVVQHDNGQGIDPMESVRFIWQVYQANGEHWDLQPDIDTRLFSQITSIPKLNWKYRTEVPASNDSFIGSSCIIHAPIPADDESFHTWLNEKDIVDDARRHDEAVLELDAAEIRKSRRKRNSKKQNG